MAPGAPTRRELISAEPAPPAIHRADPPAPAVLTVAASDGAPIAVHHLAGERDLPPVLFSHATGFHAHCYVPVAEALAGVYCSFGIDHRGHVYTPRPEGWDVDWSAFGTDAVAVAATLAPDGGLVGVGHSMGGAALLMAAADRPDQFARLVLFEPIVPNHDIADGTRGRDWMESLPIVQGARRRRRTFASVDEAIANYSEKPPLSLMTPRALQMYVEHGVRPTPGGDGVELRCHPDVEAEVFIGSQQNRVWDLLPTIATPVVLITGLVEDDQPSRYVEGAAERLPNGSVVSLPHQTHFGPFSHPDEFAELILG